MADSTDTKESCKNKEPQTPQNTIRHNVAAVEVSSPSLSNDHRSDCTSELMKMANNADSSTERSAAKSVNASSVLHNNVTDSPRIRCL